MPNWVDNKLEIIGDIEHVQQVVEAIKGNRMWTEIFGFALGNERVKPLLHILMSLF